MGRSNSSETRKKGVKKGRRDRPKKMVAGRKAGGRSHEGLGVECAEETKTRYSTNWKKKKKRQRIQPVIGWAKDAVDCIGEARGRRKVGERGVPCAGRSQTTKCFPKKNGAEKKLRQQEHQKGTETGRGSGENGVTTESPAGDLKMKESEGKRSPSKDDREEEGSDSRRRPGRRFKETV